MEINQVWPDWQVEEAIGQGSYGTVYKCVNGEGKYSAIKVISVPQNELELKSGAAAGMTDEQKRSYYKEIIDDFVNEIKLLEELKGAPNIVGIEDSLVVEKPVGIGWQIFIRMELLTDFQSYLSSHPMGEEDVIRLGIDVCNALTVCGDKSIIHRDIKPENIFVDSEGSFKLGDFGVAKQLEKTEGSMSRRGTYNYMAPEVLSAKRYDSRADIYSLGIVMYKLLNKNRLPFIDPEKQIVKYSERQEAFEKRIHGEKIPPVSGVSPELNKIVLQACAFKPDDRFRRVMDLKQSLEKLLPDNKAASDASSDLLDRIKEKNIKAAVCAVLVLAILAGGAVLLKNVRGGKNPSRELVSQQQGAVNAESILAGKAVGDTVELGSYPQTAVTDEKLIEKLDGVEKSWNTYDYYSAEGISDYMQYADFEYNSGKYRAVKFSSFRPSMNGAEPSNEYPQQRINGYFEGKTYYFRYEPIEWIILDMESGMLVSERVLDSQPFQTATEVKDGAEYVNDGFASDYIDSTMQSWLNDDFFFCAFSGNQRKLIRKNKHISEKISSENGELTGEKVSLLTKGAALNAGYRFSSSEAADRNRVAVGTDYAKCQGCVCGNNGEASWWLRSPEDESEMYAVSISGSIGADNVRYANIGVRPVIELLANANQSAGTEKATSEEEKISESSTEESTEETSESTSEPETETVPPVTENLDTASDGDGLVFYDSGEEYRIVLSWTNSSADLDAHLMFSEGDQSGHVCYNSKNAYDSDGALLASLEADSQDGAGPEVITLYKPYSGEYTFYVYNYSASSELSNTHAFVEVYSNDGAIATFDVPESGSGNQWTVFRLVNGQMERINTIE